MLRLTCRYVLPLKVCASAAAALDPRSNYLSWFSCGRASVGGTQFGEASFPAEGTHQEVAALRGLPFRRRRFVGRSW
jgi:hypothetical protein